MIFSRKPKTVQYPSLFMNDTTSSIYESTSHKHLVSKGAKILLSQVHVFGTKT